MNIVIRHESENEYKLVEGITRDAFWNLYFPGCDEHFVVKKIRDHKDFIPELSFVIELDGRLVGSIFYTHSKVVSADGTEYRTISFGPVCIHPDVHRIGLGRKLITYSIEEAKRLGYSAIMILGYPFHYQTYGFLGAKKYNVSMMDGKYYVGLMMLPLYEGALDGISGKAVFSDVFEVDKDELEEYDKTFLPKEKAVKESQKLFETYSTMLDE